MLLLPNDTFCSSGISVGRVQVVGYVPRDRLVIPSVIDAAQGGNSVLSG